MKSRFLSIFAALVLTGIPLLSNGHGYRLGHIAIRHPWSAPAQTPTGMGYLTLRNQGTEDDQLIAVSAAIATKSELHISLKTGAGLKSEPIDAITIPAGGEIKLEPSGSHIIFINLKKSLKEGERFPVTLQFKNAGMITVDMFVQKNAKSSIY